MSKPNWDKAPEWANYLSLNYALNWVWHEKEPSPNWSKLDWYSSGAMQFAGEEEFKGICEKRP